MTGNPTYKQNLTVKYYLPQYKSVDGVYVATPDTGCVSTPVSYSVGQDAAGKYITIQVPLWSIGI